MQTSPIKLYNFGCDTFAKPEECYSITVMMMGARSINCPVNQEGKKKIIFFSLFISHQECL